MKKKLFIYFKAINYKENKLQ